MTRILALASLALLGAATFAAPVPQPKERPAEPAPARALPDGTVLNLREFRDAPWRELFEWLTEQTGVPVITTWKPCGRINFAPGERRQCSVAEFLTLLNIDLAPRGYQLVRRERCFTIEGI
jgi:hypothetical protein